MFFISYNLSFVWSDNFVLSISCIFKIRKNYLIILIKIMRRKQICKINQFFTCKHEINASYAKVPTHYWIVCLYSNNIGFYIFISNKFFNFFRNIFNTAAIEINNFIFLQNKAIQYVSISAYSSSLITYAPSFTFLGKLSLEKSPINLYFKIC